VEAIKASFDIASYANMALWKFGILGIIVTLIIQSSGALGIMALAALDAGIITFPASIAIAM
jgi:Na+/phosphate symporter